MNKISIVLLLAFATGCQVQTSAQETGVVEVSPDNSAIRIVGRVKHNGDSVVIYWPATAIEIKFRGTNLSAELTDEHGENYYNVEVNNDSTFYIRLKKGKHTYSILQDLPDTVHSVRLIKRTEWDKGTSAFHGFKMAGGKLLPVEKPSGRVIEFFGNSITAGYAIEDNTGGDSPDSIYTNNYLTYAAITARHFNADLYCTVKSGIGVMISWFPLIMPEMYNRLDPNDSTSRWDFQKVQPDIVVINLLQNDSWLVEKPEHPSFKARFGKTKPTPNQIVDAYARFLSDIRYVYPNAEIVCLLGSMDIVKEGSPWPGYVQAAVSKVDDKKVYIHHFPFLAKNGHPRVSDNKIMAESLIHFIDKNLSW